MARFERSLIASDAAERERLLDALRATGSIAAAARTTGVARGTVLRLRQRNPAFAAAVGAVTGSSTPDALEAALLARAIHGVERTRTYADGRVDRWREFDHRLGLEMLKKRLPQKYGDGPQAVEPVKVMTRAEFFAALEARPRTADVAIDVDADVET